MDQRRDDGRFTHPGLPDDQEHGRRASRTPLINLLEKPLSTCETFELLYQEWPKIPRLEQQLPTEGRRPDECLGVISASAPRAVKFGPFPAAESLGERPALSLLPSKSSAILRAFVVDRCGSFSKRWVSSATTGCGKCLNLPMGKEAWRCCPAI